MVSNFRLQSWMQCSMHSNYRWEIRGETRAEGGKLINVAGKIRMFSANDGGLAMNALSRLLLT
jgi:hypothetical protein